jgi:glucosylceramidase
MIHRIVPACFCIAFLFLCFSPLEAASVSWQCSIQSAPWVDKGTLTTTPWDNDVASYLTIDEKTTYQEYDGQGGCFNELGWKCLLKVPQKDRDSCMKLLFDSVNGCNFNLCRMPIGMSDYSIAYYSLDDVSGDLAMNSVNIDGDRKYLLPFVKAAMAIRPSLKVWGSPWTPPYWMKLGDGTMNQTSPYLTAYALYFAKAIKLYQQEGLRYFAICPQNEAAWSGAGKTWSCGWTGEQMRDFIKNYLGPRFRTDDVNAELWMGTINCDAKNCGPASYVPISPIVLADTVANAYCTGIGVQYSVNTVQGWRNSYPEKRIMETETDCGTLPTGTNPGAYWTYAENTDNDMRSYYSKGCNSYMQWNIVLDTSGANLRTPSGWRQYSMIQIDTTAGKVIYTPQFYAVRHWCYVKAGAYRIATSGTYLDGIAFRNPDGENILIAHNFFSTPQTIAFNFNGQKIKPSLPAHSFNTFRIAGTPIPALSPFTQIEAEKEDFQAGTFKKSCSEGGLCVSYIHNNDWATYRNLDFAGGAGSFSARVAGAAGGTIEVRLDSMMGTVVGTCTVPASTAWNTVTCPVTGVSGRHSIYLKFKGTGTGNLFDLNWLKFGAQTGIASSMSRLGGRQFMVMTTLTPGKSPMLMLEFPRPLARGLVTVRLFETSGRLAATLYAGRPSSPRLTLPLDRARIPAGGYVIKISADNAVACIKSVVF